MFEVQLVDREAYRAMLSFGGTVAGLAGKGVSGLAAAIVNADAFVDELLARPATATSRSKGRRLPDDRRTEARRPDRFFAVPQASAQG